MWFSKNVREFRLFALDLEKLSHYQFNGSPTIILESVVDHDIWIWHAYFDLLGPNNGINVLEASHLFTNLVEGITSLTHYVI